MRFPDGLTERQLATSRDGWYALHTRYQHEKTATQILANKGLEVLLPLYTAVHRWKDRDRTLALPLFPCYVFIKGGLSRQLDILTTPGIHGWVGCGGRPAFIPNHEIEAIQRVIERCRTVEPHPYLTCGDRVRVMAGPLAGLEGILVRKKNLFRLVLSVELLERSAAVEVDASCVERVAARPSVSLGYSHTLSAAWT